MHTFITIIIGFFYIFYFLHYFNSRQYYNGRNMKEVRGKIMGVIIEI